MPITGIPRNPRTGLDSPDYYPARTGVYRGLCADLLEYALLDVLTEHLESIGCFRFVSTTSLTLG